MAGFGEFGHAAASSHPAIAAAARRTAGKLLRFTAGKLQLAEEEETTGDDSGGLEDKSPRWAAIRNGEGGEEWPPFWTVFKNPPRAYAVACGVGALMSFCTVVCVALHMRRLLSCPQSPRRSLYVRMAALLVVLSISGLFALCFAKVVGLYANMSCLGHII